MSIHRSLLGLIAATALVPTLAHSQESGTPVRRVISIGNHPRVDGLRLNFRDRELDLVRGANVTIWSPYNDAGGTVKGLAVGLPITGADRISGIGIALAGISANEDLRGLMLGGIGAGAGGDMRGITIGGIGAGAGGSVRGLAIGGVGVGAGGDARGILIGGVGVGAGGDVTGLAIGGVGVGAGGTLHGVALGIVGVAAPRIEGIAVGSFVRAEKVRGLVISPLMFRSLRSAEVRGVTASGVNIVHGHQRGLAIGLVNYTESMNGLQLGGINIIRDNPRGRRVLPVLNWGK